ncbi:P27 family phage terminase small subunit [Niallia sp. RD1]|uniref:P27 family phage terminase small subunit n=1 Tax=Niallia sp. RD1 TaxID=2962858 RepID=UPI0020C1AA17|nr:P27 family phage terminase small subunit [Niallia sp. RD1]UTI44425.1 P27 family phage terminase small subunit [Niallia sp. RD1]
MARPTKSVKTMSKNLTKEEINARTKLEDKLKGAADDLSPPNYFNATQKSIFNSIVSELQTSGILGNADVYVLETCSFAIYELQIIRKAINKKPGLRYDKDIIKARESYTKDFFRCCNELSLSPQSRAKIGNINIQAQIKEDDPLLKVLSGGKK